MNEDGQADIIDLVKSKKICVYNDYGILGFSSAKAICDLLNEEYERIQELENENKQLKAQLEKGGDVCSICKYEYLVASSEYYTAKCEKGYDECSKGDVGYCKDFELEDDGDVDGKIS